MRPIVSAEAPTLTARADDGAVYEVVAQRRPPTSLGRGLSPTDVLRLQPATGNAAVVGLLQRAASDGVGGAPAADHLTSPRFAGDPTLEACYENRARLGVGDSGASVVAVQQALSDLGYDLGSWGVDGAYGDATAAAVRAFKHDEDLGSEQYGDVGPGTMHRLDYLFPPPDGTPLCRGETEDVIVADTAHSDAAADAAGGPLLAFGIPAGFCQLRPAITQFSDIPADVRRRLKVSYGIGAGVDQKTIDEAYQPWTDPLHKRPKAPARLNMTVLFGSGIPDTPVVRESLRRVIFTITGSGGVLSPMSTTNLNIGLVRDADGNEMPGGVFRFTRFKVGKTPETVLVERLGAGTQPPPSYLTLDRDGFERAWKFRNFKLAGQGWDGPTGKTRVGQLEWVLVNSPQKALFTMLKDVTFEYTAKPPGAKEDGHWDPNTKTLSLYYGVFDSSAQRVGTMPYYAEVIEHEIGHALLDTFDPPGLPAFATALKADGGQPATTDSRHALEEEFAEAFAVFVLDNQLLSALRPKVAELFWKRYVR
jgi:peptidoglycan hydrolase-like protein with peptidoglycan-binding domain